MTTIASPHLPGRLGSPGMLLQDDPRADPRMIAAMAPLGMAGAPAPMPVDPSSPREAQLAYCVAAEASPWEADDAPASFQTVAYGGHDLRRPVVPWSAGRCLVRRQCKWHTVHRGMSAEHITASGTCRQSAAVTFGAP